MLIIDYCNHGCFSDNYQFKPISRVYFPENNRYNITTPDIPIINLSVYSTSNLAYPPNLSIKAIFFLLTNDIYNKTTQKTQLPI